MAAIVRFAASPLKTTSYKGIAHTSQRLLSSSVRSSKEVAFAFESVRQRKNDVAFVEETDSNEREIILAASMEFSRRARMYFLQLTE
jgi:hypothetical protein